MRRRYGGGFCLAPEPAAMSIDPRRLATRSLVFGAAWIGGLVELAALARRRWTAPRSH